MLQRIFEIKPLDEEYINTLLDDIDDLDLSDKTPTIDDIVYSINNSNRDFEDVSSIIISRLMDIILSKFVEELNTYIRSHGNDDTEVSSEIFFNYIDSHYLLQINGNEYWIDEVIDDYIAATTDEEKEECFIKACEECNIYIDPDTENKSLEDILYDLEKYGITEDIDLDELDHYVKGDMVSYSLSKSEATILGIMKLLIVNKVDNLNYEYNIDHSNDINKEIEEINKEIDNICYLIKYEKLTNIIIDLGYSHKLVDLLDEFVNDVITDNIEKSI